MPAFLFTAGALLCVIGLFLIGFFIPNREFSVGSTGILAGAMALVGGLTAIGLASVVRELRKLSKQLEKPAQVVQPAVSLPRPPAPTPVRAMPRPPAAATPRAQRAEPRVDVPPADKPPAEPPPPAAPIIGDITAERTPTGLFASLHRKPAQPSRHETPSMPAPIPPRNETFELPPFDHKEPSASPELAPRSSPLSALAARTAARLDLPRPVPDLPRVAPEPPSSARPAPFEREREAERPNEKPRNLFDTVWPTGTQPPAEQTADAERNDRRESLAEPNETHAPDILKSGVIDGMAYTLYTDGSIEAQLPQGTLRFGSIDDLRAHLERQH